jgi:large subunit ribosomal protein L24
MAKLKIRKGDTVEILTGKDRGKRGKVLETIPTQGRVLVEGRNLVKRHERARPVAGTRGAQMTPGGVITKPAPLDASNVGLVCPSCSKVTRIGYTVRTDGTKVRACKKCSSQIEGS